jgi:hypothetical protein
MIEARLKRAAVDGMGKQAPNEVQAKLFRQDYLFKLIVK